MALSATGPIGAVLAEFATQFVPQQRLDRLQNFVEHLGERLGGLEGELRERVTSSPAFAALTEEATLAAVRTPSAERRRDLATALKNGFDHLDARLAEDLALVRLLERINEPQVLILMSYGNFKRTLRDPALEEFQRQHPGLFDVQPPTLGSGPDHRRRWAMYTHYVGELVASGLLEDSEGMAKSPVRRVRITELGRLLLDLIGRTAAPT